MPVSSGRVEDAGPRMPHFRIAGPPSRRKRRACDHSHSGNRPWPLLSYKVDRALARDALCRGFDPCQRRPRGVAVDFGPKQSGWLINQLGSPTFFFLKIIEGMVQRVQLSSRRRTQFAFSPRVSLRNTMHPPLQRAFFTCVSSVDLRVSVYQATPPALGLLQ